MKNTGLMVGVAAALLLTTLSTAAFANDGGGSEGGTNVDAATGELVEFQKRERIKIDPKVFEGLYQRLKPRLDNLEDRIPGLGKALSLYLTEKNWYLTTEEFKPRNDNEVQPIKQDGTSININVVRFKAMSQEQRQRAWFHELVRGYVGYAEQWDSRVEEITPVLYFGYNLPSHVLEVQLGGHYGTKSKFAKVIKEHAIFPFFNAVCNGILKNKKGVSDLPIQDKEKLAKAIYVYLKGTAKIPEVEDILNDSLLQNYYRHENLNFRYSLKELKYIMDRGSYSSYASGVIVSAQRVCESLDAKTLDFLRRMFVPERRVVAPGSQKDSLTLDEALSLLNAKHPATAQTDVKKTATNLSKPAAADPKAASAASNAQTVAQPAK